MSYTEKIIKTFSQTQLLFQYVMYEVVKSWKMSFYFYIKSDSFVGKMASFEDREKKKRVGIGCERGAKW